jgi:hypothetical protein
MAIAATIATPLHQRDVLRGLTSVRPLADGDQEEQGVVRAQACANNIEVMWARSIVAMVAIAATSCASEPAPVTTADYLADLQSICVDTAATLDALPQPPDQITVADFATSAASALGNEAERARSLAVPTELNGDHRAFIRNTDEQSAAWTAISAAGDDNTQLEELTVRVGELVRGRNDLAGEMGAVECRRGDV